MKTLFRATVMLGVLGAAGWAVVEYGAADAVRPFTTQAIELADRMIGRPGASVSPTDARFVSSVRQNVPQLLLGPETLGTKTTLRDSSRDSSLKKTPSLSRSPFQQSSPPTPTTPAPTSLAQLQMLGARDVEATSWGASGQLHRVCCEVPLSNAQAITQHFEAVAASPEQAATLLLTEIRTWQAARGSLAAQ